MSSISSAQAKAMAAAQARRGLLKAGDSSAEEYAAYQSQYQAAQYSQGQSQYQAAQYSQGGVPQYSQYSQGQVGMPSQGCQVTKEVPVCSWDVRLVMVPKSISETYIMQETRMVAIQIPVSYTRVKEIRVPREISIPRPIVEKRLVKKMVPKVIQVEDSYEIEIALTQLKTFFRGADSNNDNRLSYEEWAAANQGKDAATIKADFVSSFSDLSTDCRDLTDP